MPGRWMQFACTLAKALNRSGLRNATGSRVPRSGNLCEFPPAADAVIPSPTGGASVGHESATVRRTEADLSQLDLGCRGLAVLVVTPAVRKALHVQDAGVAGTGRDLLDGIARERLAGRE